MVGFYAMIIRSFAYPACESAKRERPRSAPRPSVIGSGTPTLVEGVLHAAERRVQLAAKALHDRDDRDRDAGGDQSILDGGRARLVLDETRNEGLHG